MDRRQQTREPAGHSRPARNVDCAGGPSMIQVERLKKAYGTKVAVDGLDLRVEPGEILGFLGPNGAGKSTTVKVITGLIKPDQGRVSVCGYDVVQQPLEVK